LPSTKFQLSTAKLEQDGPSFIVVAYIRKSDKLISGRFSLPAQEKEIKEWCDEESGWRWTRTYSDEETGSSIEKREAIQQLLADARERAFDIVAVAKEDRFGRDVKEALWMLDELRKYGVRLVIKSVRFLDLWTAEGRSVFVQLVNMAEYERMKISQHTRRGVKQKQRSGEWVGQAPYGYKVKSDVVDKGGGVLKKENTRLIEREDEQTVIVIIRELDEKGLNASEIASELEKMGIVTRRKKGWRAGGVRAVLDRNYSRIALYIEGDGSKINE